MTYVFKGQKEIKTKWPITEGLTAGTTKQTGKVMNLIPQLGSIVSRKEKIGIQTNS